jgi:hypothetical protein
LIQPSSKKSKCKFHVQKLKNNFQKLKPKKKLNPKKKSFNIFENFTGTNLALPLSEPGFAQKT